MNKSHLSYFNEIEEIEKQYSKIIEHYNTSFPKPINFMEEKKKFFSAIADDKKYNPYIIYEKKEFGNDLINKLKEFKIDTKNDPYNFKKLYKKKIISKIYEFECHQNWGKPISTKYVIKYRGKPSRFLLAKAKIFCLRYNRQIIKFKRLDPETIGNSLKDEVYRLTGDDIRLLYVQMPSKVNIDPSNSVIKINPNVRFTTFDLDRLLVHEIGTHYMRFHNGKKYGIKLLERGTDNYIETEEGLAAYVEELKGVSSKAQLFIYAGRVIATFYAIKKSFYEVFAILKQYGFKDEDAFMITYRAKRNISDTSLPGGFTKDYVYFSGYYKVKKYVGKNSKKLKRLFLGKIKISDIRLLRKFIKEHENSIETIFDKNENVN